MGERSEGKKGLDDVEELSRSLDWHVRRKVAWSADTPGNILDTLALDKVQWVREAVAGNSRASPQALARLADDSSGYVRAAVALNSCVTSEILEMLAADEMVDYDCTLQKNRYLVKEAAAKSPHINPPTLAFLARDPEEHVRAAAAFNILLSVESMGKMVKDVFWEVRNNIAKNPSTPEDLLIYLSADRIMDVGPRPRKIPGRLRRRWRSLLQTGAGKLGRLWPAMNC